MAAVLDISILSSVTSVFIFLLVFIGGWGVMTLADPFKDKGKSFYGIISFLIAILVVLSKGVTGVILFATPWLVVLGLVAFFFLFFAKMFMVSEGDITSAMKGSFGWFIFFIALIMVFAIGTSLGPSLTKAQFPNQGTTNGTVTPGAPGSTATADFGSNLLFTLFNPKIVGVLFMFLLGTLTILLIK